LWLLVQAWWLLVQAWWLLVRAWWLLAQAWWLLKRIFLPRKPSQLRDSKPYLDQNRYSTPIPVDIHNLLQRYLSNKHHCRYEYIRVDNLVAVE
jgi:hypothetical protein